MKNQYLIDAQTFTFEGVAAGTYKLVILKPGKYVPKIVEIEVGTETFDAGQQKLWLYGDVNGDGVVNGNDIQRLYAHITKSNVIEDSEALLVADANADGTINGNDIQRIYAHITKTNEFPG